MSNKKLTSFQDSPFAVSEEEYKQFLQNQKNGGLPKEDIDRLINYINREDEEVESNDMTR
jgi:hypothetical protein